MRNVKIYFDGVLQNKDDLKGIKNAGFTYRSKDENGANGFSFSPELTAYNDAFDYIKNNIITKPIPQLEQIKVKILDECCTDTSGQPVELMTYIRTLEGALATKAKVHLLPMQPGDVPATNADISELSKLTHFSPATSVVEGVRRFVDWYRNFYSV